MYSLPLGINTLVVEVSYYVVAQCQMVIGITQMKSYKIIVCQLLFSFYD